MQGEHSGGLGELTPWEQAWLEQHELGVESLLSEREAVETALFPHIRSAASLRQARVKGVMSGTSAPPFMKIGRSCFYKVGDAFEWLRKNMQRVA